MSTLALALFATALFQQPPSLIGTWEGVDPYGVRAILELKQDGSALLKIGEQNLFANEAGLNSPKLLFSLDTSKSPVHFDLTVINASGEEVRKAKLLIRWENENQISLAMGPQLQFRPASFDKSERVHTLSLNRK